jgi:P2 family phage contractile tail tube protein
MLEVGTIDFAVYEGSDEFVGIASVTLPDKNQKAIKMSGAGIGGEVDVPITGQYEAMSMDMSFRNYSSRVARLREHRRHTIELRVAQQNEDTTSGQLVTDAVKHVMIVVPKSASGGTVAPATSGDMKINFSVRGWETYINGKLLDAVDPLNRVDIVNGIDYNAPVRKALGKA